MLWRPIAALCFCGLLALQAFAKPASLDRMREQYSDAVVAIDRGNWTEYRQLRSGLEDYPLAIYLDYFELARQAQKVPLDDVRDFMTRSEGTPLTNRLLRDVLFSAGQSRRWSDFLDLMPKEPSTLELKCYYYRARLANGDRDEAWSGADELWTHGRSRPDACDPLFAAWMRAGELDDDTVWRRLQLVMEERQSSLLRYVASKAGPDLRPYSDALLRAYSRPGRFKPDALPTNSAYTRDLIVSVLAHHARSDPEAALANWQRWRGQYAFNDAQVRRVDYAIALRSLFAKSDANLPWLEGALERLDDDLLVEIRLRWALGEIDWAGVQGALPLLSTAKSNDSGWRYWRGVAALERGNREQAESIFKSLANERGFYSFLAADRLGQPYEFRNAPLVLRSEAAEPLRTLPAVQRVQELYYHDRTMDAHSEWTRVLAGANEEELPSLALLAAQEGWYRFSIDAANKARASDWLAMRFPLAYEDTFAQYALLHGVPASELMAIARRESAFHAGVRSSAGARGLMQVMPATGKLVARDIGEPHSREQLYDVEHNVLLGSTYYKQLLDQFGGNRIFALAGYNAGPHRVERWRRESAGSLPVDVWIETIPFRETRGYVQAVLAYNVVFGHLQNEERPLLRESERTARY